MKKIARIQSDKRYPPHRFQYLPCTYQRKQEALKD